MMMVRLRLNLRRPIDQNLSISKRSISKTITTNQKDSITEPTKTKTTTNSKSFEVFDRRSKVIQRSRSLRRFEPEEIRKTDYLREEVSSGLVDRLLDIKNRFDEILEFGSGPGFLLKELYEVYELKRLIMVDSSKEMLWRDHESDPTDVEIERILMDEENLEKIEDNSKDCIISCLSLHWVNDLPGTLIQIKNALKPGGVFIGAMLGGDTLFELRTSLQLAEQEREGGISPRVSPMTDSRSMSSLINRAGFSIPTIDNDEITVRYPSMFELIEDLRLMGESNSILNRRSFLKRDTLLAASSIYNALYGSSSSNSKPRDRSKTDDKTKEDENFKKGDNEEGEEGEGRGLNVPATFQVIYFIGWKPDPKNLNINQPLKSGTFADRSLKELGESSQL